MAKKVSNPSDIDLDAIVDYRAEYSAAVEKAKVTGDRLIGLCPFHRDKNASFSADLKTGKFNCFACDAHGNYVTFYAKQQGIETAEAYNAILSKYGMTLDPDAPRAAVRERSYSVTMYSLEKRLPEAFLTQVCKLSSGKDKDGSPYIKIPYMDEIGKEVTFRKRYPAGAETRFKWKYGSTGKIGLYGEWRLDRIREQGYCILVEGESDTQTLWHLGFPALGVAGASLFKPEFAPKLEGLKVYIHVEPDQGGQHFLSHTLKSLHDGYFLGEVYSWSCRSFAQKDPSALYIQYGADDAKAKIKQAIADALKIDLEKAAEAVPEVVQGAPINLRVPEGFIFDDKGIALCNQKTAFLPRYFCRTPVLITKRLRGVDAEGEKIELAFKRDGEWQTTIQQRSMVFQARSITELSNLGITVSSESAKDLVRFLSALEAENFDLIPRSDSTTHLGWQPGKRFIPGQELDLVLDVDPSMLGMVRGYSASGTLAEWIRMVNPHRSRHIFRFIVAASFAAPLLRIVNQRIFFVYNWAGSRGGKTAALKAALSAWGDPSRILGNFNATGVALERMASMYCDLPLGLDERQLAGRNQESIERIVYMLAEGQGRTRGAKTGGLQTTNTWRSVIISTGEEPLSTETSQSGVASRVLELYGAPFEDEASASLMHQQTALFHGTAGPAFIARLVEAGETEICDTYDLVSGYIASRHGKFNGAHIAGLAVVGAADILASQWIFDGDYSAACRDTMAMLDSIIAKLKADEVQDVNEYARQYVADWIISNKDYFTPYCNGRQLGFFEDEYVFVLPSLLSEALTKGGYSPRKTMKHLAETGAIIPPQAGGSEGTTRYAGLRRFNGYPSRMLQIHMGQLTKAPEMFRFKETALPPDVFPAKT
ncbi:MAG: DUF927 domain-containing protein [Clostridia bacterium]|nr:DUF927 domain-containing protein [Clostridia bacterium]